MLRPNGIAYRSLALVLLLPSIAPPAWATRGEPPAQTKQAASTSQSRENLEPGFRAAVAAYQAGQYAEARRDLELLLPAHPNSFPLNELAGLVEVALGHDQEANAHLAKAVRLSPNAAEARTALAMNLMRLHRDREAETQLRKAVELEPRNHDVNHNLGEFYIQARRLSEGILYLKRAQEIQPRDYNNGYDLALAYEQTGSLAQARRQLERLVQINDTAELHALLAEIEEKGKNYMAAAQQYEQAARMDPSEGNLFDLGAELLLHQTFQPAVAVFQSGVARYPHSVRLSLGLGVALYGSGHFDEGAAEFFRVADANPSDPLPVIFLGRAYDNFSRAVEEQASLRLEHAVEAFPRNAPVRYYYAMSLWKQYQDQPERLSLGKIELLLKSAIALDGQYGDAYLQLGIVYARQQRYRDAIAQYRQALKGNQYTAAIHFRLGQALARSGETAAARQEFAVFERLRAREISGAEKQNADIQQFVYTMKNPGE